MDSKELVLSVMRSLGKKESDELREAASSMTASEIIAKERAVPYWQANKDYSEWPVGAPVSYDGQVYSLITPHNAAFYPDLTPLNGRTLWNLCHTTDPLKAKAYVAPDGTSGLYMNNECYEDQNGNVYVCVEDNTVYNAEDYPSAWMAWPFKNKSEEES